MNQHKIVSIEEICDWFGVPKELIESSHPLREESKKAEAGVKNFLEYSIKPWMERHGLGQ